jgi:hypothetical protein
MIKIESSRFFIAAGEGSGSPKLALNLNIIHWNLILFGCLVLLAPVRVLRAGWKRLLTGAALLWCSHVFFFVLMTLTALGMVYESQHVPFLSPELLLVISGTSLIYGSILSPVIPFFLAAPFLLARPKPRPPHQDRGAPPPGRNDPCPCGSGKKLKRCCGRTA